MAVVTPAVAKNRIHGASPVTPRRWCRCLRMIERSSETSGTTIATQNGIELSGWYGPFNVASYTTNPFLLGVRVSDRTTATTISATSRSADGINRRSC